MADRIDKLLKRAAELYRSGDLSNADAACRAILSKHPGHSDVLNLRGIIAGQTGRMDAAVNCFRQALAGAPDNAAILTNLAEALRLQGKASEAVPLFRRAALVAPGYAAAHFKLATTLLDLGRPDDSFAACRAGLLQNPEEPNLNGLAAELLIQQRRPAEAVSHLIIALKYATDFDEHWKRLDRLLRQTALPPDSGRPWLLKALHHPVIHPSNIAKSIAATICMDMTIEKLVSLIEKGELAHGKTLTEWLTKLGSNTLLLSLMETTYIPYIILERVFTDLRRALLLELDSHAFPQEVLPFCAALAIQSFLTDYAWYVTDEEEHLVDQLTAHIGAHLHEENTPESLALMLALVGAYRPLHRLENAAGIAQRFWPAALSGLLRVQISEPLEEQALRDQIPRLTPVADSVSQQVRAQYEENPYPSWVRTIRASSRISLPVLIQSLGGKIPADLSFKTPDVLIAGCGTGQQSVQISSMYAHAKVLAIDLSLTSLAYAWRKTRELGIDNIEYQQADIMELKGLDRRFHIISCSGVLHHLADPLAGWQVLVDLLHTGGLMNIGLYSEIAGRTVTMAREQISAKGYLPTATDIRRYRHEILELPDAHPLSSLKNSNDFFTVNECRDYLFHVKEHRFSLPWIQNALDHLGLRFLGFNFADTYRYQMRFPDDPRMRSLENWHLFELENPDTFLEMYQFRVQKM